MLALEALDQVGLLSKAFSRTDQLSGGQQQRVGIARAIVKTPKLILADEPVASLDPMISFQVLSLLKEISLSKGITVLCNLHQVDYALHFADRVIGLAEGQIVIDKSKDEKSFFFKIWKFRLIVSIDRLIPARLAGVELEKNKAIYKKTGTNTVVKLLD